MNKLITFKMDTIESISITAFEVSYATFELSKNKKIVVTN